MTIFKDSQIAVDFGFLSFKKKLELKNKIINNGGILSYVLTKTSKCLVLCDLDKLESSYKCRMALKNGVPVVSPDFLDACIQAGDMIGVGPYLLGQQNKMESFKHGKIAANLEVKSQKKKALLKSAVQNIKMWASDDIEAPRFPENYHVAKWAVLTKSVKSSKVEQVQFQVLELHALDEEIRNTVEFPYRIFIHNGIFSSHSGVTNDTQEYCYVDSVEKAVLTFVQFYKKKTSPPLSFIRTMNLSQFPDKNFGSKNFYKIINDNNPVKIHPGDAVLELAEHIWQEAVGHVENLLPLGIDKLEPNKIVQAESSLLQIKRSLINNDSKEKLAELSEDFRKALNLSKEGFVPITSKKQLIQNQDFCQLLKDIWSINESTNWKSLGARTKYSALHCDISCLVRNSTEYANIENMIFNSENWDPAIQIHNVYKIERFIEEDNFVQEMDNKRLLFHGSAPQNLLGILFRGLLLPNILTEEFGGVRSDEGMLGNGIYFSDSPSYSLKFGHASKVKGTRFVFVHEVALGNCQDVYHTNFSLSQAPEGFDSIHGVKQKPESLTDFNDDEYVIYKLNQQRMKYLIEFSEMENPIKKVKFSLAEQQEEISESQVDKTIGVNDVKGVTDPLTNAKIGLIASGNVCLPLKSVHVKASLIDMVAKVIIFQAYTNDSNSAIEAKYVFPLSDLATVVGFEAFINNKHVVGKVKEKEIAHQEYKEAIDRGHGAYLMDQEAADVFTVSVGNLPPKASVLIKITYLEELSVEGECILFSLPGSMAPWKKDLAFSQVTQSSVPVIGMMDSSPQETTIEVAIEMPYAIRTISSPSHLIRIKRTDTYAMVETAKNSKLAEGFQLLIGLAEIHVPRMWVGNYGTDLREACMLTFYPEFVVNESTQVEIILLLDMSNSMRSNEVDSKKMALLILDFLPENCLFNIITFGQGYQEMFPSSQKALPRNIETATMFIQNAMAQMGSTELLKPLKSFYLLSSNTSDLKNLFVISDGHFNDQHLILQSTKKCNSTVRVFSLGIGSTANKHVLRGLAKAGAGSFEFFDNKMKSKWEAKIKCLVSKTSQPVLTDVRVEWQQFNEDAPQPIQAPKVITSLFNGSRLVVYGFTSGCRLATLKAVIDGCEVSTIVSTPQLSVNEGMMLHQLTTKALIQDWEDGILHAEPAEHELLKKTNQAFIIELSKEYSVVSSLTSFVAVEERSKDEEISGDVVDFQELISQESSQMLDYLPWEDDLMTIADSNQEALLDYEAESDYCDSSEDDDMGFGEFDERSRGLSDNDYDPPSPSYAEDYCAMDSEASSSAVPRIIKHGDEVYEPRVAKMLSCPPARPVLKGGGWGDENDQNEVSSFAVRRIIKHGDEVYEPRVARRLYCPPARPVLRGGGWGDENNEKERDRTRKSAPPCSSQESEDESDQNEAMDSESYEEAQSMSHEVVSTADEMHCLSMPLSHAPTFEECSVGMTKKKKKIAFKEEESLKPLSKKCSVTPDSSKTYASVLCGSMNAGKPGASPASFLANDLCPDGVRGPTDIMATSESTGEFSSKHPIGFGGSMSHAFAAPVFSFGNSAALKKPGFSPATNNTEIGPPLLFGSSPQTVPKVIFGQTSRPMEELTTPSIGETNLNSLADLQTLTSSLFGENTTLAFAACPPPAACPSAAIGTPPAASPTSLHTKRAPEPTTFSLRDKSHVVVSRSRHSYARRSKAPSKPVVSFAPTELPSPPKPPTNYFSYSSNLFQAEDDNFSAGDYINSQLIYLDSASGGSSDDSDSDDSIDRSQQSEDELPKTMNIDEANIFFSYIKNEPVSFLEPKYEPVSPVSINTPDSSIDVFNYQNELGFWEFGPEVDKFLGISSDQCRKQLYEAGLKSFGPDIEEDIQRLIATMMVVVILATIKSKDILNVLEKSLIYQRSPFSIKDSDFSDFFKLRIEHLLASTPKKQHMALALEYIFKTVNKCAWVSDALHLSNNWWEAVYHFLSMDELDSVEYDSKSDDYWIKTR